MTANDGLSRRERQIMDLVYELSAVTVRDLVERLPDPPTDGAVRTMLARLEQKGLLRKGTRTGRSRWTPVTPRGRAKQNALSRLLRTFFDGSVEQAVSALLDNPSGLDDEQLDRLAKLIEQRREQTR
jgi:BlaI family transcriptional regulator, penicillinase repressor